MSVRARDVLSTQARAPMWCVMQGHVHTHVCAYRVPCMPHHVHAVRTHNMMHKYHIHVHRELHAYASCKQKNLTCGRLISKVVQMESPNVTCTHYYCNTADTVGAHAVRILSQVHAAHILSTAHTFQNLSLTHKRILCASFHKPTL